MENKYKNGKIYKIVCNIKSETYYGSTIQTLRKRLIQHKTNKKIKCVSRNIIDRGDYKMELIKDYPCNSRYELEEEEKKYIIENECINVKIPHRTQKEYKEDNKDKIKQYWNDVKEEYNNKKAEKITCECGAVIRRDSLTKHIKSFKHEKLTQCIIID